MRTRLDPAAAASLAGRRVVFVFTWSAFGGAERKALFLAEHLRDVEGVEVAIVALTEREGRAADAAGELGIPWHVAHVDWAGSKLEKARELGRLVRSLRGVRPDVLLPQCTLASTLCGLTWRATGARLCVWNQCDVVGSRRTATRLIRRSLASSPLAVACAHHGRDVLIAEYGASPERVHVVYGEVRIPAPAAPREEWRGRLGLDTGGVAVCMLANFKPGKDHATLLRAWRLVLDRRADGRPPVTLVLAGADAGTMSDAKALAYDLELGRSVRFAGGVADVAGLLGAVDVAVLASESECLGRGVLEPMAAGLPVVGTDNPGIREALGPGAADALVPSRDTGALATSLGQLLEHEDLRRRRGQANAERIRTVFAPDRTTDAYVRLLRDAVAA